MSNQDKITALYCRLSKDDLNVGDSDSIVHGVVVERLLFTCFLRFYYLFY